MTSLCPDFLSCAMEAMASILEEDCIQYTLKAVKEDSYSLCQAGCDWQVSYTKLYRYIHSRHSCSKNGSNRMKLTIVKELALFGWINIQLLLGWSLIY